MFLQYPPETEAASMMLQGDQDHLGFVMNLTRAWAWRPELYQAFVDLRAQLTGRSSLTPRELAVIVCATASARGDSYCSLAWGKKLAAASDAQTAAAVLQGAEVETLSARERAIAAWARQVVRDPKATTQSQVNALRSAGLSDSEIFEATAFVAFRLAFSSINDALGIKPDWQVQAEAPPEVRGVVLFGRRAEERPV